MVALSFVHFPAGPLHNQVRVHAHLFWLCTRYVCGRMKCIFERLMCVRLRYSYCTPRGRTRKRGDSF